MVRRPGVFLMDEPLSNLDARLRTHMRGKIAELHQRLGATFIYVTHDQSEAMTLSDRIALMMEGEIIQLGTPDELYERPDNIRVAKFIGSPEINLLPALVRSGRSMVRQPLCVSLLRIVPSQSVSVHSECTPQMLMQTDRSFN